MACEKRGRPDNQKIVHLYEKQYRAGMVEGRDYNLKVLCNNGSWHIWYTKNVDRVTCPACIERMQKNELA